MRLVEIDIGREREREGERRRFKNHGFISDMNKEFFFAEIS